MIVRTVGRGTITVIYKMFCNGRLVCVVYCCLFVDPNVSEVVLNLSSVEFSNLELTILSHSLDHCIPSRSIKRVEVYSEFEVLFAQLRRLQPVSTDRVCDLKARLNDLAHTYAGTPVSSWESDWRNEHFRTLKSHRSNNSTFITWPEKSSEVVILDYQCCVDKMMFILDDTSKFLSLGPVDSFDHTTFIETKFQTRLVELVKRGLLPSAISDQIRPTGSIRLRLYGLPKTHKDKVPLIPILSMVGSSQQKVTKWLDRILQPVLMHYSKYCIKDSFKFGGFIRECSPLNKFMCSFDICSLFIYVPILEAIDICADMLYQSYLAPTWYSRGSVCRINEIRNYMLNLVLITSYIDRWMEFR